MYQLAFFAIGLCVGVVLAGLSVWLIFRKSAEVAARKATSDAQIETAHALENSARELLDARERLAGAQSTVVALQSQVTHLGEEVLTLTRKREDLSTSQLALQTQIAQLTTTLDEERKQSAEKIAFAAEARAQLNLVFKTTANEILEEKSQRFTANLDEILEPLRTKIQEFQTQVQNTYVQDSNDRTALRVQVQQLLQLNQQLSDDANNLTKALTGSSVELGDWGEMILEQILEGCGLQKDSQYFIQPTYTKRDGSRVRPDAVVLLPENRTLVVDSKASLNAYYEYTRAQTEETKSNTLNEHLRAVRQHVSDLSVRDYEDIPDLACPDFVIMFVPIEPAFILAVTHDRKLWQDAWKKNVLLVSPSSLLFVIRIVANLWTQDAQKKHFKEIADRGGALYDKLVGFVEDLQAVGAALTGATEKYESALRKLSSGRGNAIRQAEMLKELGVRPSKDLPPDLVAQSNDEPMPETTFTGGSPSPSNN